jgi:sulfur carrier protein
MQISVNGEPLEIEAERTIAQLLALLALRGRLAVELNGEIVARSRYEVRTLCAGDRLEIVKAIGGG